MTMPEMSGPEVFDSGCARSGPDLPVVLMSGYHEDELADGGRSRDQRLRPEAVHAGRSRQPDARSPSSGRRRRQPGCRASPVESAQLRLGQLRRVGERAGPDRPRRARPPRRVPAPRAPPGRRPCRGRRSAPRRSSTPIRPSRRNRSTIRPRSQRVVEAKGIAGAREGAGRERARRRRVGRSAGASAANRHQVSERALPQRGRRGRQSVAPMSMRAWVQSPGRSGSTEASAIACIRPAGERTGVASRRGPGRGPAGRSCRRPRPAPERDRGDGAGRVRADPGQALEGGDVARDPAAVLGDDRPRRASQVERPAVVAHPLPRAKDVGRRRGGEVGDGREAIDEPAPRLDDPRDLGLLGHHLRHEDRVRIARRRGTRARGRARRTRRGRRRARRRQRAARSRVRRSRRGPASAGHRPRAYHRPDARARRPSPCSPTPSGSAPRSGSSGPTGRRSARRVETAEAAGADDLWIDDHLLADEGDADDAKLEGWTTLAAAGRGHDPRPARPARRREHVPQPGPDRQARDDARPHQRRAGDPRARRRLVRGGARRRSGSSSEAASASGSIAWPSRSRSSGGCSTASASATTAGSTSCATRWPRRARSRPTCRS